MDVLIVDDDPFALDNLEHVLRKLGHVPHRAESPDDALAALRHSPVRALITDWDMPGMSGPELCTLIRADPRLGYVYSIILTSHDQPAQRVAGLDAGADDFLVKPAHPVEIRLCLQRAQRILALETRDLAMFAMAKLVEGRDHDTGAHVERVQCFAQTLAHEMARRNAFAPPLDAEFVRLVFQTSSLHDIGKVGVPDAVLLKPGRLSEDELLVMRSHAALGARTLDAALARYPSAAFLRMARDIAAAHHERWDGRGYPAGLSGTDIPLAARIVALADVYDAITARRVYKPSIDPDRARALILSERGRHFDPEVTDAFEAVEPLFRDIAIRMADDVDPPAPAHASPDPQGPLSLSSSVLVVEDDPITADLVARALGKLGVDIRVVHDGDAALLALRDRSAGVIVSDWNLPGLSGIELCRAVRASDPGSPSQFIMLTIYDSRDGLLQAFDAGVDDFILKPFHTGELLARVRSALRSVRLLEELAAKSQVADRLSNHLASVNKRLSALVITDELTGLYNRRHATMRLEEQWTIVQRLSRPVSVVMLDIDHFKSVNDRFGHDAGDAVLRHIADTIRKTCTAHDIACRVGGEELMVLLPERDAEHAFRFAERLRWALAHSAIEYRGQRISITASLGVACADPAQAGTPDSPSELLRAADSAMYHAKQSGRNRSCIWTPPGPPLASAA